MKTMMLATAAVLGLGIASAFADGGEGPVANTQFTSLPGVVAQAPSQSSSAVAQNGSGPMAYVTSTHRSAVAFPWNQNEGVGG
jgi:hypothetical protein